jgi:hypothetical protein
MSVRLMPVIAAAIPLAVLALVGLAPRGALAAPVGIEGARGTVATIDAAAGRYTVRGGALHWAFAGTLGARAVNVARQDGEDRLGVYQELAFRWRDGVPFTGSIRAYRDRPAVLFRITADEPLPDAAVLRFPRFTSFPKALHHFSYANHEFAPASFALEETATPWLLYDESGNAAVLSPASQYMIASLHGDGTAVIASGLNPGVGALPAGFSYATLLVFGTGVNATWDSWGAALIALAGARRPANDADQGLRYLGYWTDNGAAYYYDYDQRLGYAGTLEALVERYRTEGIPIRYLQLDSWWYSKSLTDPDGRSGKPKNESLPAGEWNRYGGLLRYEAHPALFPEGLAVFQHRIGLPLIAHNRWIDPASPYHERFSISGLAALDPRWWNEIMGYLAAARVATYEQDWLSVIYQRSSELVTRPGAGEAFTDEMAQAAAEHGLTLQYSMALPRHFLQGTRYGNLTTIRVSGDRLTPDKWDGFLYGSRLASALGIWPWADVFMSHETDNLLLATLSAGMVGIGDRIGAEDQANLLRAVRADGVIVKPDTPAVPIDSRYTAAPREPMIAAAHTDHGALRTSYVFCYGRGSAAARASFTPAEAGVRQAAYVYDMRRHSAQHLEASQAFRLVLSPRETAYFVVTPVSRAGLALVGDEDQLVPDGRARIAALEDGPRQLIATVIFAPQESSARLLGYAPRRPVAIAQSGSVGEMSFDPSGGRFEVTVAPAVEAHVADEGALRAGQPASADPVRTAVVSFSLGSREGQR